MSNADKSRSGGNSSEFQIPYDQDGRIDFAAFENQMSDIRSARKKQKRRDVYKGIAKLAVPFVAAGVGVYIRANNDDRFVIVDDREMRSQERTPTEQRLGKIAANISGLQDIAVLCNVDMSVFDQNKTDNYSPSGAFLKARQTASHKPGVFLDTAGCTLIKYANNVKEIDQHYVADAVFTFAHEVAHATGIDDESLANCSAVDLFPVVTDSLGLTDLLQEFDPLEIAKSSSSPAKYHQAGC